MSIVGEVHILGVDIGVKSFTAFSLPNYVITKFDAIPWARSKQLVDVFTHLQEQLTSDYKVYVEEPPLAGSRNIRTFLRLAEIHATILLAAEGAGTVVHSVPVNTWKLEVCGKGGINKVQVADWLREEDPEIYEYCGTDQNVVDAACIALYGWKDSSLPARGHLVQR